MSERFVLAYDLGTSGVKGVLLTMTGEVVAACTADYPLHIPREGWAEQVPEDYWNGVCQVTKDVLKKAQILPDVVAGLAFGTMWKGIIPVDKDGNVLHNSIIWLDARAGEQAKRLNEKFPKAFFGAADYWPKLTWLRENRPEVIEQADMILETNSYLKWKATGVAAMDISNSYVRSFDPELEKFYEDFLAFIDIPQEKFPRLVPAHELVGHVTEQAAGEMGLVPGIPVFAGNNDIQAVSVGSGCSAIGGVHVYFGSSGWVGYTVPHTPSRYPSAYSEDRDVVLAGMRAIGLSFNWVVKKLFATEYEAMGDKVFAWIDEQVSDIAPGSEGLIGLPWFHGDHPPYPGTEARGCFINLNPAHDRRHMARAIMEGVCYHLKMRASGNKYDWPEFFSAIGGGSCSDVWMQMLADVMNTPVRVPADTRHAGAIGTAYSVLIGLGECSDYSEAAQRIRFERTFNPRPEAVAAYEKSYAAFRQLAETLKPIFAMLNSKETEAKK